MDIENLTKSQIILLTLLVSFVTSIATGIVTVSLMDQAPPAITQTLEKVVERTVQQVVPATAGAQGAAAASVTTEKTIVMKEADLMPQAIAKAAPSVVRIYGGPADAPEFLGMGVVVSTKGMITTDLGILPEAGEALYVDNGGPLLFTSVISRQRSTGLALLQSATSTDNGPVSWKAAIISSDVPALGQAVISLSGRTSTRADSGIVSSFASTEGSAQSALKNVIATNIRGVLLPGSVLLNLDGSVIGISTSASRDASDSGFIASSALLAHINALNSK